MDALYHNDWAISIIKGGWLGKDAFFRAPLYPYFLSLLYRIFGINLLIPRIAQCLIGSFNCVLASKIGTVLFKKKIGIVSGIIACVYPLFIYFDNELLIPTILIFLVLFGFYLILQHSSSESSKLAWFITGVVWGLAAITRPNVLLFLIIFPFWLFKKMKKNFKTAILYGILGVMTMVIPVTIRNYVVSKDFVFIAWQGGTNFYIGNNPQADGFTAIVPGTRKSWWGGFYDAKRIAEEAMGRDLKNSEIDRYWMKQGLAFIKKQPSKAFNLFLKKTYLFFGGFEIGNNRDLYFFSHLTYLKFLIFNLPLFQFPFGLLFPLSLLGIFIFFTHSDYVKKRKINIWLTLIFIMSYSLSFIIFFVCTRYRLVIIPFLIIYASFAIIFYITKIKKRRFNELLIPSLFFIPCYLFFNANVFHVKQSNPALNYITLTNAYKKMGRTREAQDSFQRAIELDPCTVGTMFHEAGDYEAAKKLYLRAIAADPYLARAYNNLGNIYFEAGDYERAVECYSNASILRPDHPAPLYHAGLAYEKLGNLAKAESLWQKALTINPDDEKIKGALEDIRRP